MRCNITIFLFARDCAKFCRILYSPSHSLKILKKENESFPNSYSPRIEGNDRRFYYQMEVGRPGGNGPEQSLGFQVIMLGNCHPRKKERDKAVVLLGPSTSDRLCMSLQPLLE